MYCTKEEFWNNNTALKQAILSNFNAMNWNYYSWYEETGYLQSYYLNMQVTLLKPVSQTVMACYERLYNYWLKDKLESYNAEIDLAKNNINYENFLKQRGFWDKLFEDNGFFGIINKYWVLIPVFLALYIFKD